jgi:hypothetical protein
MQTVVIIFLLFNIINIVSYIEIIFNDFSNYSKYDPNKRYVRIGIYKTTLLTQLREDWYLKNNTAYTVMWGYFAHMWKHLHDRIILVREEVSEPWN